MTVAQISEARRLRSKYGWSFKRLGEKFGLHPTTVYYALNPRARSRWVSTGKQRSVYLSDDVWVALGRLSAHGRKSRSQVLAELVLERDAVLSGVVPIFMENA